MKTIYSKLLLAIKQVAAFFPTRLPTGATEFAQWSDSIYELYAKDVKTTEVDDFRFALAGAVMHLGATESSKPKRFFGKLLHKGAASQVAYFIMKEIKDRHDAADKAAKAPATGTALANGSK